MDFPFNPNLFLKKNTTFTQNNFLDKIDTLFDKITIKIVKRDAMCRT